MTALELKNYVLGYQGAYKTRIILEDVELKIPSGEFVLLLGPSGGGKSSLSTALLGLEDAYSPHLHQEGRLEVFGTQVSSPLPKSLRTKLGAVFQEGALIDDLSPYENMLLAARAIGKGKEEIDRCLLSVGLKTLAKKVSTLSGGEKKRLALARALLREPEFLLLDEPTAGLDPDSAKSIAHLLRELHDEQSIEESETNESKKACTLVITHDVDIFSEVADSFLLLDPRMGKIHYYPIAELQMRLNEQAQRYKREAAPVAMLSPKLSQWLGSKVKKFLLSCARIFSLFQQIGQALWPSYPGMLGRALLTDLLSPAPFYALSAIAGGFLVTNFALETAPLKEAFRREILVGTGHVLLSVALPLLMALLVAARSSAGSASRIGALRQQKVFEALPLMGISPTSFLLSPLLWSSLICSLACSAIGIVIGLLACLWSTLLSTGMSSQAWASTVFSTIGPSEFKWIILKALGSGFIIAVTTFALASQPKYSAQEVANSTKGAIVWSTLLVLCYHGLLTLWQYR